MLRWIFIIPYLVGVVTIGIILIGLLTGQITQHGCILGGCSFCPS